VQRPNARTWRRRPPLARWLAALLCALGWALAPAGIASAQDVSAPAILSWFDGTYRTQERRAADVFRAGYGAVWLPPPGRADSGNQSVGYDVYDRFDLGSSGRPTLYGTETGLKTAVSNLHRAGVDVHVDAVFNHNGFSDRSTPGFERAGGYPGFVLSTPSDPDGDFHSPFDTGDLNGRLSGLIDIDHSTNHRYVRNPVPGFANNIPAGAVPAFGRLANVPQEGNRRFYPDRDLAPIVVFDPQTGEKNIRIHPFNNESPMAGDPVEENATGYLMRYAQWMVQHVGVDGFRLDAAKHYERFVLNYFDRAVYRSSNRYLLDGSRKQVFSYGEVYVSSRAFQQQFVRKDINSNDPGRVGGNRDVLDFPQFFALRDNLTSNGLVNDWRRVVGAGMDVNDDGLHNGSQGVLFAASHDDFGPALSNVAHAYTLMHPGNAVVYFNGREHGDGRDFPKDGRGDALGGLYGDRVTDLVTLRNTHGRGNYRERWLDKELFAYEREGAALVLLNNRGDGGFDARTLTVTQPAGTYLVELTGNAANPLMDPRGEIPEVVQVGAGGRVNVRFARNANADGQFHGNGYLVYGPATPQGRLEVEGPSALVVGETPTAATNGSARLSHLSVVCGDRLRVKLSTNAVNLLGNPALRDRDADGDNALLRIDEGLDLNGNGRADFVTPGSVAYGFESFTTVRSPGYFSATGNGLYEQEVDASALSEGYHFLEVRAFRHRGDGGPAVYTPFRETLYVDRLRPESGVASFAPRPGGSGPDDRELLVRSLDLTADRVHVLLDLPQDLTNAQVAALVGAGNAAGAIDRDLFRRQLDNLSAGNHAATVVTIEITGTCNVQRFGGLFVDGAMGAGFGDLDRDGTYESADVELFADMALGGLAAFHPSADINGDAWIDRADFALFGTRLREAAAAPGVLAAYERLAGNVPEPGAAMLLVASAPMLVRCRARR
jgi:alpha-amylase